MKDIITTYEHSILTIGKDFSEKHLSALEKFLGGNDNFPYYSLIHRGIKFKQYVGILKVGDLTIEVLPKLDDVVAEETEWRKRLTYMLSKVLQLQSSITSSVFQNTTQSKILDIFLLKYLNEVELLLHKGLIKSYHRKTDNKNSIRGKLLVSQNITKNIIHQEKFVVNFTTYDYNNVLNSVLRQALEVVLKITLNSTIKGKTKNLLLTFPEVKPISNIVNSIQRIVYDRKNEDYKTAIELAKLILSNYTPDLQFGRNDVFALMFDMNKLWEEFVSKTLSSMLPDATVLAQKNNYYFVLNGKTSKKIRPDIIIKTKDDIFVLDTKWKKEKVDFPADADLKQMYHYLKFYKAKKSALLYPSKDVKVDNGNFLCEKGINDGICNLIFLPCPQRDVVDTVWKDTITDFLN